ncbi:internalin, partial [Kitasatospora sp. NPDC018619]
VDDATYNDDASNGAVYDPAAKRLTWTGDVAKGATVAVTYSVTVNRPPTGDKVLTNAVVNTDGSPCAPGDCTTTTPVRALEIRKTSTPANPRPGDTVTYTVTVTNAGQADYRGASFTDDLSGVVDDATYNNDASAGAVYDPVAKKLTWTGDVAKGATVAVTYSVTVDNPPTGDKELANAVTSTPDVTCAACGTNTPLPALTIDKSGTPKDIKAGDTVTYTLTVTNTGQADYPGATLTDDLSGVVDDATYNNDASNGAVYDPASKKLTWTGDVAKGATVTITYSVTATLTGDGKLANTVTAPGSNCVQGSGDPRCGETLPAPRLEITKTAAPVAAVPGGTVTYTIALKNTGTVAYKGATYTDDLTGLLDDATYNDDARTTGGAVRYQRPLLTWDGDVPAGATVTTTYTVTVDDPPTGDLLLGNAVTSTSTTNCPRPMPIRAAQAIDPNCTTTTPVQRLTVIKANKPGGPVAPGDTITYTITATNSGKADFNPATFTDDLSGLLADATYHDNATADSGTVTRTGTTLTWTGPLSTGQSVTLTYTVTVKPDPVGTHLRNAVTSTTPGSTCVEGTDPRCGTDNPIIPTTQPPPPLPPTGAGPGTGPTALLALLTALVGTALVTLSHRTRRRRESH